MSEILNGTKARMQKTIEVLAREYATLRAGRASPALLERVSVEYYGQVMPLNQVAQVSVPDPRLLVIQPWDKSLLGEIEKALLKSDLGITPTNDGQVIRVAMPQLTEERRKELVRVVHKKAEDERVAIRNLRREAMDRLKRQEKDGELSEDEARRLEEAVQRLTDEHIREIDRAAEAKEKEILAV